MKKRHGKNHHSYWYGKCVETNCNRSRASEDDWRCVYHSQLYYWPYWGRGILVNDKKPLTDI